MADTMKGLKRTHYCGTVTPEMIGREVVVCGWAQKTRDMGTLVFIDLRGTGNFGNDRKHFE